MTESISLDLNPEEAFYTYHTLCTYLLGDYPRPRYATGATTEDVRRVASKIETGTDEMHLSPVEAHALAKAYSSAGQNTPLDYPFAEVRNLAEKIYDTVPEESRETLNYGSNWAKIRQRILERDDYECQNCGMDNENHRSQRGYELHVHHVRPLREFSDVEAANQPENLITLCASCHGKLEGRSLEVADLA